MNPAPPDTTNWPEIPPPGPMYWPSFSPPAQYRGDVPRDTPEPVQPDEVPMIPEAPPASAPRPPRDPVPTPVRAWMDLH